MGLLDDFRNIPESAEWAAAGGHNPTLASVVAAGGRATGRLSPRARTFLWVMLPLEVVAAVLSPLLAGGLAQSSGGGDLFAFGAGLLSAPHPAVQPAALGAAALLLLVLAIVTRGFTRVTTSTSRFSMTAGVVGIVAGLPFALVILAFTVVAALGIAVLIGIGFMIVAMVSQ